MSCRVHAEPVPTLQEAQAEVVTAARQLVGGQDPLTGQIIQGADLFTSGAAALRLRRALEAYERALGENG